MATQQTEYVSMSFDRPTTSFEPPAAASLSAPGTLPSSIISRSNVFLSQWRQTFNSYCLVLAFFAGMGWIATVASVVIAAMFVYNWLTKDNSLLPAGEADLSQKISSSPEIQREGRNVDRGAGDDITFVLETQSPTLPPDSKVEQKSVQEKASSNSKPRPSPPIPQFTTMPPPASPIVTPAPTVMAPPPRPKSPPRLKPPTIGQAPLAPRPGGMSLRPPPSAASSLRVPATKVLSNASMAPSALMPPPKKVSRQVVLEPGHSPLDWAALTSSPNNKLRGKDVPDHLIKITPSQLKAQNGRKGKDAWTVYQGRVYNITPYVPFHPGGKGELMRGAGKDSAKLFMEVHPWVNWDGMLGECCVGILVGEDIEKEATENRLDEMD